MSLQSEVLQLMQQANSGDADVWIRLDGTLSTELDTLYSPAGVVSVAAAAASKRRFPHERDGRKITEALHRMFERRPDLATRARLYVCQGLVRFALGDEVFAQDLSRLVRFSDGMALLLLLLDDMQVEESSWPVLIADAIRAYKR